MSEARIYRPISYMRSNTDELAREIAARSCTVVITEGGAPSFVCLTVDEYEQMQETIALLKLIHLGRQDFREGKFTELAEARRLLDQRILNRPSASPAAGAATAEETPHPAGPDRPR